MTITGFKFKFKFNSEVKISGMPNVIIPKIKDGKLITFNATALTFKLEDLSLELLHSLKCPNGILFIYPFENELNILSPDNYIRIINGSEKPYNHLKQTFEIFYDKFELNG